MSKISKQREKLIRGKATKIYNNRAKFSFLCGLTLMWPTGVKFQNKIPCAKSNDLSPLHVEHFITFKCILNGVLYFSCSNPLKVL
jgi:hypothetical protein